MMWKAVFTVTLFVAFTVIVTFFGLFRNAKTELGLNHYAEKQHFMSIFPLWLKMPFNTLINVGYIIVGAYWCAVTTLSMENKLLTVVESYLFYVFNISSAYYGAVQTLRIITQKHEFAVLDQWLTLPFFMLVFVWGLYLKYGWSAYRAAVFITISLASYALTLVTNIGFEITLGVHVLLALYGGLTSYFQHPSSASQLNFILAFLCCGGFIVLKILDLHLVKYHTVFTIISGHFLSKIFDILQIYYVNEFFQSIIITKWRKSSKMFNVNKKTKRD